MRRLKRYSCNVSPKKRDDVVVVLEAGDTEAANAFMKSLAAHAKVVTVQTRKRRNVFDVTNALSARDPVEACAILNNLFAQGIIRCRSWGADLVLGEIAAPFVR